MLSFLDAVLTIIAMILFVFGNVQWYTMKNILKKHGYPVRYWRGLFVHLKDFPNFWGLIKKEKNPKLQSKYQGIFWSVIISFILFTTIGLSMTAAAN